MSKEQTTWQDKFTEDEGTIQRIYDNVYVTQILKEDWDTRNKEDPQGLTHECKTHLISECSCKGACGCHWF
jgi:hypothetical protein